MQFVQILFVCKLRAPGAGQQVLADTAALQLACHGSGLTGFFIATEEGFVGLFEGVEPAVFAQMEYLVRSRKFCDIQVIREITPKERSCSKWYVARTREARADVDRILVPEQLAEFVSSALKPLTKQ